MSGHVDTETLALFAEGLLSRRHSGRVRSHLSECASCASARAQLGQIPSLLAAAPAPPMPADVAARLTAALSAEAATAAGRAAVTSGAADVAAAGAARAGEPDPDRTAQPDGGPPSAALPGIHRRATRREAAGHRWPVLRSPTAVRVLAAAAAVVVLAGGGYGLSQLHSSAGSASSSSAAAPASRQGAAGTRPNFAAPNNSAIPVVTSGTDYRSGQLAGQAAAVLQQNHLTGPVHTGHAVVPAAGGTNRPATASDTMRACLSAVALGGQARLVDQASYNGRPASIVVVAGSSKQPSYALVISPPCPAARPRIVARAALPAAG